MSEVFSILLHNRQRYEQGNEGLWFSLPTTTEKLQEALREIGISADNPQDFFLYDYRSPQERPIKLPRDLVLSADVDELNFLAARLEKLDAAELTELNAALTSPQSDFRSIGQIIDYPDNVDYYVHLPDVTGTGQLGDYYLNRSGMVDMPEEWKAGIFLPRFGLHIANTEHGVFTDYGYLVKSGDEWQRVHEGQPVPEEYRVMAYPAPEADRDAFRTEQPAPAAVLPEAAPIITKDKSKDEYMKEITDRLEAGVRGIMSSDNYKSYLASMSKFHSYSFRNTMLIFMQKPDASLVAGLGKWKSEFERTRKQGEIGLKILAPAYYKVKKRVPKIDPDTGEPIKDKDGKTVMEEQTITVPDYRAVSVYDVSQTEGKELPTTHVDVLDGDVEHFQDLQAALIQASPYPISIEPILDGAKGRCFYLEQRIAVNEGMSELQTLKTSIHEVAHARLYEKNSNLPEDQMPDRATREVQAESVAYTVCQYFGLDTSDYSFGYIANWSSGKDLEELQASLETIRSTANNLINEMEAHLLELQQQRQAQQTVEQTVEPTVEQAAEQPAPDSVFSKLPPEQQQEMTDSVKAMLQTLIDADVKSTGEVTQGTLDAIQTQGFVLSGDGTLQRAEAQEAAYRLESGNILFIQTSENGFDYTMYGPDYKEIDGGQLDNTEYSLSEARDEILSGIAPQGHVTETITGDALEDFQEAAEQANAISVQPEPQPWNGIDGLLNNKPIMPEATPTERAKEMNSFSDYKPGSATAEYRHYVDEAFALAQEQKKRVDPMYHEKIDSLLDTYARKLAANMNHGYEIDARVPSILIAGGSNFPVRKKEKQNAARDSNMQEWQYIQGLLDKIRSTGMGGIRQDDPQAIPKLQKKLAGLEKAQETMKAVNAYYRKHGTLDGCPHLSPESLENLKADMASGWHYEKKPFQSWELSNNNAEIRRVRQRIESLTRANEVAYVGWEFDGGHVEANRDQGRLQVFFDGKPEADARQQLKEHGFRWAPSVGAWQRLLNDNAYYASDRIACIQPLSGIKPTELQRNSSREQRAQAAQKQAEPDYFYRVHANPRSDSRENLYMLQAYIPQDNGRAKIGDVLYVGTPERCRELMDQLNTGELTQEAVKELYAKEQEQPTQEPTPEQEPAPEPEQEPVQETETAPAQEVISDAEPQAAPAETLTELQEKALEIAGRYKDLPLQAKIDVIAQAFGCKTGEIHTSPCTGKWRGTSDMTIRFDNGASLFIGNHLTPKAKTVKVQTECVNRTLVQYNPEIVKATKEAALPALLQREAKDNEIAARKGLKPYTLLNVEFNEGADEKTGGYIGWYYVTLAVDGKICTHLETGLNHDIASGKVSDTPTRADYYPAGALKEADVDYVFNNVGFSSASTLYTVPLRDDVRERAEKTLAERSAAAPEAGREWGFYIIPDLKTWATNAEQQTPIEHFATFEEAKTRFDELRSQPYNSEAKDLNTDGRPYAHLTLGMESKDGMSAADILHVRTGQNYLVEDFTRMERLRSDPVVLESLSRVAKEIGFDRVRPYVMENGSYKAMPDMPFTQWENPYFTVDPPAQEQGDTFAIYQLKGRPETRDYRFEAYERLQAAGLAVDRQNYDLVYTAPLDGKTTLEDIYRTFNLDRPADFTGHSLSVSDVVVLTRSGKEEAHYCDSFGFTPVPEFFLQRKKQLTPRELLTGESIQTPRGSFLVTDMSREQLEAAGYGFHHQSEDGKYLIMGNGTDAFAIPAQQESPIKAAEMTTEQNYNMIDGVLNNAPTMSELEAKAKAGEQISLFDVAEAAKAEAQKPKQPQRPAQKQKKPSIRAQLKAAKEEQQKKSPQREKTQELEV